MKRLKHIRTLLACAALLALQGCASTPTRESTGGYVHDALITTKVKAAIFREPSLKSTEINVETTKGAVQLSGLVSSRMNIATAIRVARAVTGVRIVQDELRVKQ